MTSGRKENTQHWQQSGENRSHPKGKKIFGRRFGTSGSLQNFWTKRWGTEAESWGRIGRKCWRQCLPSTSETGTKLQCFESNICFPATNEGRPVQNWSASNVMLNLSIKMFTFHAHQLISQNGRQLPSSHYLPKGLYFTLKLSVKLCQTESVFQPQITCQNVSYEYLHLHLGANKIAPKWAPSVPSRTTELDGADGRQSEVFLYLI